MKNDIKYKIKEKFGRNSQEIIKEIVDFQTKDGFTDRIIRCILHRSDGTRESYNRLVDLAKTDVRDLIFQAENDCTENRRRDLTEGFHEIAHYFVDFGKPEHGWLSIQLGGPWGSHTIDASDVPCDSLLQLTESVLRSSTASTSSI